MELARVHVVKEKPRKFAGTSISFDEEFPLTNTINVAPRRKPGLKGPFRVVRLCLLGILLPCCLAILVLYLRYRVFVETLYPLAVSDMRMLDSRISTTWCKGQKVRVNNATFNAFLLPSTPTMTKSSKPLFMDRHLVLEDDTKEYWGFYLLRGSVVTISTCVRWPGASLVVIRGHKHLHDCAYIGDNSSEELDEVLEAMNDGTYVNTQSPEQDDGAPANAPDLMKRHRTDVQFHHPQHNKTTNNHTLHNDGLDNTDITDHDPKHMKKVLDVLSTKNNKEKRQHVHRNSTVGKGEDKNVNFSPAIIYNSAQSNNTMKDNLIHEILQKLHGMGQNGQDALKTINERFNNKTQEIHSNKTRTRAKPANFDMGKRRKREINNNSVDSVEEITQEIIRKLVLQGANGKYILKSINDLFYADIKESDLEKEANDKVESEKKTQREKRHIYIKSMTDDLNNHDEENDMGVEQGFNPDGIADHHAIVNETTLNDKSNSEFWSSFSSSEERLLNCSGLILNLPLTPHRMCTKDMDEQQIKEAYLANSVTYQVPTNGYYFFVFGSENEIQPNYIRVSFNIHKTLYNVSNPVQACKNKTESCSLDFSFFSNEKLVMELPIKEEEDLFNEEYIVISECEPRTAIYILCVIAVPVLVVLFAFQ